jgi:UDP-N-acetylglucosamine acyltransferase
MPIHPTAIIDKTAEIDPTADIGPYAIVERGVRIGAGTRLYGHAYVAEGTTLGARCQVHPFAVLGHLPQDFKYRGEPSYLEVGDETVIREHVAVHRGSMPGSTTVIGCRCLIMCTAHVGHNCIVADGATIAGTLAGHVEIGPRAFVSGCAVHQFVRIGELAMLGGGARVFMDVPPFMTAIERNQVVGPNVVGLRRAGFTSAERLEIRQVFQKLYRSRLAFPDALEQAAQMVQTAPGQRLVAFLRAPSKRGIIVSRPALGDAAEAVVD